MANKIIIGVLVFLTLITGGLGAYAILLNGRIDDVTGDIGTLNTELSTFRQETATGISDVKDNISGLGTELTTFKSETASQITGVTAEIDGVRDNIGTLESALTSFKSKTTSQISGVNREIAQSTINVQKIYQTVRKGVCEITDGEELLGSGFILDTDGHIITAQHVIDGVTRIDVILYDGTISSAIVIGECKYSDVAVLKLRKNVTLTPLDLADSDSISPGEPVIAVGSPFELSGTVTVGIVSQTGRARVIGDWWTFNLLQYDAPSNFGNSGGPLFTSGGDVIGLIVARVSPTLGEGIYFAVSSNKVKRVAESVIDTGSFENTTLPGNWQLANLTPQDARDRNMETANGVLFTEANGVGTVRVDDVVIAVDGVPVNGGADLFNYFGDYKSPGDTVTLTVIRGFREIEIDVELIEGWVSVT